MAEPNEIEDLRDWFIETCAEILARTDALNGDEPAECVAKIKNCAGQMHAQGLDLVKWLDNLLIQKKRAEELEDL